MRNKLKFITIEIDSAINFTRRRGLYRMPYEVRSISLVPICADRDRKKELTLPEIFFN